MSSVAGTSFGCNAVREGNYVMRVAWPGAARNADKFIECAKRTIKFNTPAAGVPASRVTDDPNLRTDLVKPSPPKRNIRIGQEQPEGYCKILKQLIADLLDLLIAPWEPEGKKSGEKKDPTGAKEPAAVPAGASTVDRARAPNLQQMLQQPTEDGRSTGQGSAAAGAAADTDQTLWKNSDKAGRPVLKKSMVMRMLAELVKSYNHVATYILAHFYTADQSPLVKEVSLDWESRWQNDCFDRSKKWSIDSLDWLIDWPNNVFTEYYSLVDWLIDRIVDALNTVLWLIDWLIDWLIWLVSIEFRGISGGFCESKPV